MNETMNQSEVVPWLLVARMREAALFVTDPPVPCDEESPISTTGWRIYRNQNFIGNMTTRIVENITVGGTVTGYQFSYGIDGRLSPWSETIRGGNHSIEIPVRPDQFEEADYYRWTFWFRMAMDDPRDCSQGFVIAGSLTVKIYAVSD